MELQIIGTAKCKETAKAKRFFSDRRIKFHFRDLNEKSLSPKEIQNISKSDFDTLIDRQSKAWLEGGYEHRIFDPEEELLDHPELIKTPIVRNDNGTVIGFDQKELKKLL